ncbi:hypothetical protein NFH98_20970 [Halomonas sp. H33-56]|uniref:hypothetical protein n=1 Tax=Halomonas sp. H33-56 TaxID=2950873 RepID=UPI0032DFAE47
MHTSSALRRLEATRCPECHGRGHSRGVFHDLECPVCVGAGYVQATTGHPLDTLAARILARAASADAVVARRRQLEAPDQGTPDRWILRNRFRGD